MFSFSYSSEACEEEEEEEPHPRRLDSSGVSQFLTVGKDRLTVSYKGSGQHPNDVGSIRSDVPVPGRQKIYYYEVTVLDDGERRKIGVGFADKEFKLQRQPGWDPNSYGYHGEHGFRFRGSEEGEEYAPPFAKGDVVGAGLHLERQDIFFTKNGKYLKVAFEGVPASELYPTIGLHSKGEKVEVNFGAKPFRFDLEGMVLEENEQLQREIRAAVISPGQVHHIVRMYLLHYGYADTLDALDEAAGLSVDERRLDDRECVALNIRRRVRKHILHGKIDSVIQILEKNFPDLLAEDNPHQEVPFCLYCQKYLELVRSGDVYKAVEYAQEALSPFRSLSQECARELKEVMAVVAYSNPEESPVKHLLTAGRREMVADVVNAAILVQSQDDGDAHRPISVLEKLLRQLVACHRQLHAENNNQGEVFTLADHLLPTVSS